MGSTEPGSEAREDRRGEIAARAAAVQARIARAAMAAGREPAEVRLITVTKGFTDEVVRAAHAAGLRRFGENRVEALASRLETLSDLTGVEWHLIGPLQSRKVRRLPEGIRLFHALDRLKIARQLEARAEELGRRLPVLLECNLSGEATKSGWRLADDDGWEEAGDQVDEIASLPHLEVRGLMTMAPLGAPDALQHRVFGLLAEARERFARRIGRPLPELSMGMSDDFEAAVGEGATLVRIGRAILGERM